MKTEISKDSMYQIENDDFKITVEERIDGIFMATFWDKNDCLENDRRVFEFETHGGATYKALELLALNLGLEVYYG